MRRFSQRNSLVTLSEINITPLLDLAFVLLIIFVITRPLLEQNIDLQLPAKHGRAGNALHRPPQYPPGRDHAPRRVFVPGTARFSPPA